VVAGLAACSEDADPQGGAGAGGGSGGSSATTSTNTTATGTGSGGGTSSTSFSDGNDWTVDGSGFGSKATDAPFRYEDFEDGTEGAVLEGWVLDDLGDRRPSYDRQQAFGGAQSLFVDLGEGIAGNGARLSNLGFTEVYFSYRMYIVDDGGVPTDGP
jgi:hypothetical protein